MQRRASREGSVIVQFGGQEFAQLPGEIEFGHRFIQIC